MVRFATCETRSHPRSENPNSTHIMQMYEVQSCNSIFLACNLQSVCIWCTHRSPSRRPSASKPGAASGRTPPAATHLPGTAGAAQGAFSLSQQGLPQDAGSTADPAGCEGPAADDDDKYSSSDYESGDEYEGLSDTQIALLEAQLDLDVLLEQQRAEDAGESTSFSPLLASD